MSDPKITDELRDAGDILPRAAALIDSLREELERSRRVNQRLLRENEELKQKQIEVS